MGCLDIEPTTLPTAIEVISRAVLISHGFVLVCRSVRKGHAYLPGGHVEPGESAAAALRRELHEEAGVSVTPTAVLQVHESVFGAGRDVHHEVNIVFHVEHQLSAPDPVASREPGLRFEWVALASLEAAGLRPEAAVSIVTAIARGITVQAFRSDVPTRST